MSCRGCTVTRQRRSQDPHKSRQTIHNLLSGPRRSSGLASVHWWSCAGLLKVFSGLHFKSGLIGVFSWARRHRIKTPAGPVSDRGLIGVLGRPVWDRVPVPGETSAGPARPKALARHWTYSGPAGGAVGTKASPVLRCLDFCRIQPWTHDGLSLVLVETIERP